MRKCAGLAFGVAVIASSFVFTPVTATALPMSAGASSSAQTVNPMIEQVQARRVGAGRAVAGRGFAGRGGGGGYRGGGYRGGRGIGAGGAAAIGLGILGIAAAASAANAQPQYYEQPACGWTRQPVYDNYGNYRGTRRVQVCD